MAVLALSWMEPSRLEGVVTTDLSAPIHGRVVTPVQSVCPDVSHDAFDIAEFGLYWLLRVRHHICSDRD